MLIWPDPSLSSSQGTVAGPSTTLYMSSSGGLFEVFLPHFSTITFSFYGLVPYKYGNVTVL